MGVVNGGSGGSRRRPWSRQQQSGPSAPPAPPAEAGLEPEFLKLIDDVIEDQRRRDALHDPAKGGAPPLEVGPQRSQDPTLWADDPRKYLPPDRQPAKLNSRKDRDYMRALESMIERGIRRQ